MKNGHNCRKFKGRKIYLLYKNWCSRLRPFQCSALRLMSVLFASTKLEIKKKLVNEETKCVIPQSSHQSPAMSSYTEYTIDNCTFLVTFSVTHALHTPVPVCFISHNKAWPSSTKLCELHWEAERNEDWIGLCSVLRPRQYSIGYMGDGFYRSKDRTNSIRVLKEMLQRTNQTTKTTKYTNAQTIMYTQKGYTLNKDNKSLVYNNMGWLGDGSHRAQVR